MSPYSAARGLLVTDLVILNQDQVTRATSQLAPSTPNFHTTPTGKHLSLDRFNVYQLSARRVFSSTRLELMRRRRGHFVTLTIRLPFPQGSVLTLPL
ncbi:hypothetical protein TNCV_3222531 [Trichonephila clavipes]|nr:hypothetical protein TNCV_3222531 [Trichonephila clavipes]